MNTGFIAAQVSLRFVIETSDHSVSNHLPSSRHISGFFNARLTGPHVCGRPCEGQASVGLRQLLAGSPQRPAESSSLALRTDRSPPVAPHPASRRRSYSWLRSARAPRQETFTLLIRYNCRHTAGSAIADRLDTTQGPVRNGGPYGFRSLPVVFALTLHQGIFSASAPPG